MKRLIIVCLILASPSLAFGDEIDERLSNQATEQVRRAARSMIRAGVNRDDAIRMTQEMLRHRFRDQQILKVHEIITQAAAEGLPVESLIGKAYEGMAKEVPDQVILAAMERMMARYRYAGGEAKSLVRKRSQQEEMRRYIADGLSAGVEKGDVERVRYWLQYRAKQMTDEERAELARESFQTMRDMARLGVSSMETTEMVCDALKHQYTAYDMVRLRKSFMLDAKNTPPDILAKHYSNALRKGADAAQIESGGRFGDGGRGGGAVGGTAGSPGGDQTGGSSDKKGYGSGSGGGRGGQR